MCVSLSKGTEKDKIHLKFQFISDLLIYFDFFNGNCYSLRGKQKDLATLRNDTQVRDDWLHPKLTRHDPADKRWADTLTTYRRQRR